MFEGVNGLNPVNYGNNEASSAKKISQEKLSSLFKVKKTGETGKTSETGLLLEKGKSSNYKEMNAALKESILDSNFIDAKTLEAKGWKRSTIMDMNGGIYYTDPETGASVRVQADSHFRNSNTFRTKDMSHHAYYDENGKATNGIVQVRQPDGSIKVYEYEYDVDGNKFIKSVKTSEFDYFASYD